MSLFTVSNTKIFDKLFEKATSPLLLEPDWEAIVQLCDIVKSQEVPAKYVVQSVKKKFGHENAHVILSALQCLESFMKNCGGGLHREVAQRDMMDAFRELTKNKPDVIRDKVLELIQCWSYGLGQHYKILTDTYNLMKLENYRFPPLKESEAMFENSDIAPEWRDDKECFRCRQTFTTFIRKHHCRACGDIFCDKCSSKQCPIPKFGIDRDVRVCDACYEKLTTPSAITSTSISRPIVSNKPSNSAPNQGQTKSQAEIDEEESFQLALAISQSEAEEKERQKKMLTQKYAMSSFLSAPPEHQPAPVIRENHESNGDYSELRKYIERGQQEQSSTMRYSNGHSTEPLSSSTTDANQFVTDQEIDQFCKLVTDHINNFKFRMLSNQQRSRNVTNDTAVQSVFVMLQHLHPEMHRFMQLLEEKRAYYENLQDKLTQLKDAREALNALRSEHQERKQHEAMERERQRQIQLAQKLDLMRQKKQEYLEYQRQIHLQRLAQQELEMKTRLEQQRQMTFAREQLTQNPQLSMVPYDYGQMPSMHPAYQQPFNSLSVQGQQSMHDPNNQYSMIPSYPPPQTAMPPNHQYSSMMMYPPKTDANYLTQIPSGMPMQSMMSYPPMPSNGETNYMHPMPVSMPMQATNVPYSHAQPPQNAPVPVPVTHEEKPEPQLISFD